MNVLSGLGKRVGPKESSQKGRRCMNCGEVIRHEATDVYSRRFCSEKCKEDYLYKK